MSTSASPGPDRLGQPEPSLGDIVSELSSNLSTLIRQEIALAKAELQDTAKKAGKGAGMFGGAGWATHFLLLFLSVALWWGLGALIGDGDRAPALGWSALIVAAVWAAVAAVLALMGRKKLKEAEGLPQTSETVQEIPSTLKGQEPS